MNTFPIKLLQLKGFAKDGSQRFRFHCKLHTMDKGMNDLTKELADYTNDPHQFCIKLNTVTAGAVVNESDPQEHTNPPSSGTNPHTSSTNPHTSCINPSPSGTNPSPSGTNPPSSQEHTTPTPSQHRKRGTGNEAEMTALKKRKTDAFQEELSGLQEEIAEQQIGKFIYHIVIAVTSSLGGK